ncbi:MAG: RidA family protein [Burkholderiales bacterium]|nr:RidA family protein [Burkholderiales bacterium]
MKKEVIKVPVKDALDEQGRRLVPISRAIKAGGFVFVAGIPPHDPQTAKIVRGDIETQTRRVLENLKLTLEAAGSSLDRVVKTTVFCTNAAYFDDVNEIYRHYFPQDPPTRTFVTVGSWPHKFDIEIEAIALAGDA